MILKYKKNYTADQLGQLLRLEMAHAEFTELKQELRAQIELEYRDRIGQLEFNESLLANKAIVSGVTKRDVQLATKTMNWDRFQQMLDLAADAVVAEEGNIRWVAEGGGWFSVARFVGRDGTVVSGPWRVLVEDGELVDVRKADVPVDVTDFVYTVLPMAEYEVLLNA